jgi:hypothetical protein
MRTGKLRTVVGFSFWMMALPLAGCHSAKQPAPANDQAATQRADAPDEARGVADASLGKQSEILAHGDLALNGREQLLVVNRFSAGGAQASKETANSSPILFTRAAVLEKDDGKWSEILRCDEHLKNPNGYLGGIPAARVSGWRLEYTQNAREGLELKFSPAERFDAVNVNVDQNSGRNNVTFDVRWNKNAKRYESFDQSHERYLSEVPSLETPASTLR